MKIIRPFARILSATPDLEKTIELAGRTCYKSEDKITDCSATAFVAKIRSINHESVLEHGAISVLFTVDRGVSHELVRHRIASFSQESTRYCNYSKDKFGNEITVIDPRGAFPEMTEAMFSTWEGAMIEAEAGYFAMVDMGAKAQLARDVLPNSLKTEIVMTTNPREWRHVFKLRCADAAHPQMREVMLPLRTQFVHLWPSLFADLTESDHV